MASIALRRDSVVDGNVDTSAEIKVVVAAIYTKFGTIMVDGDDGVIEQQDGFLTPPKSGKLLVKFVHI